MKYSAFSVSLISATLFLSGCQSTFTSEDSEVIAPNYGEVISQGPEVKKDLVGKVVFFPPQNMFPLAMIRSEAGEIYQMTTADRIDAILVKDIRKSE